jgi:glutamate-1-semialdehyde aminotransferase
MSNYSAQCQVYATQSGGNIQSATTAAHDSMALAAAAAEAAKVQMAKDMIANWNNSNDELAKKLRDRRLAGKP